jgi:hypothetical protein
MAATPAPRTPAEHRRQRQVIVGVLITLLGLLALASLLPSAPSQLTHGILIGLASMAGLWIGGVLLGNAVRPYWDRRRSR